MDTAIETKTREAVIGATMQSYRLAGYEVVCRRVEDSHSPTFVVPRLKRLERIETEDSISRVEVAELQQDRATGLEVWLVVPLKQIGEAHGRFRGVADRLQAWWVGPGE